MKYKKDVHTEHCCYEHGCKYGEDNTCTVALGLMKQSFPCEVCEYEEEFVETLTHLKVKKPGYHINDIKKGELGGISKIYEELSELEDSINQGVKIMQLVELSDLYGAIKAYVEKHHPEVKMKDIVKMSEVTKRAFDNGHR